MTTEAWPDLKSDAGRQRALDSPAKSFSYKSALANSLFVNDNFLQKNICLGFNFGALDCSQEKIIEFLHIFFFSSLSVPNLKKKTQTEKVRLCQV